MIETSARLLLLANLIPAAACGAGLDVGSGAEGLGGVDVYEKQFTWEEPERCETFLHRRIYDEEARVVSYESDLTITYTIDETSALPLGVDVDGRDGSMLSLRASEDTLEVRGDGGALALRVAGYGQGEGTVTARSVMAADPEALLLLSCTLPMRTELGYVPGFVRNLRDASAPGATGVSGSTSESPPLLPWDSEVSLLGAWARQGICLDLASDGGLDWSCGCFEISNPVAGVVRGNCP